MSSKDSILPVPAVYEQLKKVRESKTVTLKPCASLKSEFLDLAGNLQPVKLRYYQVQAVYHLLALKRMILGDATGTGKSLSLITSLLYTWEKEPTNKVIIVSPKSAIRQWAAEFEKFSTGVTTFIVDGTPLERKRTYLEWACFEGGHAVLIMGYAPLVRDWSAGATQPLLPNGQPDPKAPIKPGLLDNITTKVPNITVVCDEAHAFKSDRTKIWQVVSELSKKANRCYGMTATLLKNNLMEAYSIYKAIYPQVFTNKTAFQKEFCITQLQRVAGGRKIPIVVGYKNLVEFRNRIDPYYLGRAKHLISDELPKLVTKEVIVTLSSAEDAKYSEALTGILALGDGEIRDYEESKALVALLYCQKVVDSLSLLNYNEGDEIEINLYEGISSSVENLNSKEAALLDLLQGEFDDEKVIVYCRFASLIPRLQDLCKKQGIQSVAVTGQIVDTAKNPARKKAQDAFQDLNSKVKVIFISDAGSEAINLQAASAMIFYNSPWSWGNYIQLLGRPIRIGSPNQHVTAVHLVAERPKDKAKDRKTIDRHTLEILSKKKDLIDKVLGESAVGALDFDKNESVSFTKALSDSMKVSK